MKILFLTRRFYPDIGGVEKHVFEVAKSLAAKGHTISVITEKSSGYQVIKPNIKSINIVRISAGKDNWFKKFRIWKNLWKLKKLIEEAEIVHCHDVFFWYLPFRFLFMFKPVYTTFHGYEGFPIRKKEVLVRKLSEYLSWGNICIGEFIKKWYGTSPAYISYGGVEVSNLRSLISNKQRKESALFVGRLEENTGILNYIKAVKILKKKYPKFELAIIGDGVLEKQIKDKVTVLGIKENPDKYLDKYHFVFASGYLSILEAFSAKKLVISTYSNPLKEDYLKMTPFSKWLIIEKTPEKIAEKIEYFLNNFEKEKKITEGEFEWVKNQTWNKLVNVYLNLWKTK